MYKLIASHRFYNMNAEIEKLQFDDGIMAQRLVSYSSVVCDIVANQVYLYPRHQCSPTTVRQLTRFLNKYAPIADGEWSIGLIREALQDVEEYGCASVDRYDVSFHPYVLGTNRGW